MSGLNDDQPSSPADYIILADWKITPVPAGEKGPRSPGWNKLKNCITDPEKAANWNGNLGLVHEHSGTAALDIDDMEAAQKWFLERDVSLDALLNMEHYVGIDSGRPNRAKRLYRVNKPLKTVKPADSGFELRCAGAQDLIPPSVNPVSRRPYRWVYGSPDDHWSKLPVLPAMLYSLWRQLAPPLSSLVLAGPTAILPPQNANAPHKVTPEELRQLETVLSKRDPDCGYDEWIKMGMALHHASVGSDDGFFVWDRWSGKGKKYKGQLDLRKHWDSFSSSPGKVVVTAGSILQRDTATADEFDIEEDGQGDARPLITLESGELHNYATRCERILSDDIYVRERQLVRVGRAKELVLERDGAARRDEAQAAMIPVTPEYIRRRLNQRVRFRSYRRREKEYTQVDCPKDLALNIAGQGHWPAMRQMTAITTAPFVRPDGSICETPGYDGASRVFYEPNADFPSVPVNPTRKDAERALTMLLEPFGEFPFASDTARSAFAAHVLTEIVRPAIDTSPAFFYTAPTPGTGKTLLSEMASRIAHGCAPALRPWTEGSEELRKNLFSSLLAADRTIGFDNLPNGFKVRSPTLCGFLTADKYGDRKLGASEVASIPNRSVVSVTGNNLTPTGDLARRSLVIRLDADIATLRERRFLIPDLRGYVGEHRPVLLVAALTIICAYNASTEAIGKPPLPSFEQWSSLVRDPLLWLGMADPVATQDEETDDETAPLGEAFQRIEEALGEQEFTASNLAEMCATLLDGDPLSAAIEAAGCSADTEPKQVGYWLREMRDRIASGFKLMQGAQARGSGKKWKLRKIRP